MKTVTQKIGLLCWLAIAAVQLLPSAPTASAKSNLGLENRAWEIFPLAAGSHQANQLQVSEAQRERAPPQRSDAPDCVLGPETTAAQLEFDFVPAVERQTLARDFYQANTNWSDSRIASHLQGIDFSQPAQTVNLSAGTDLIQYQLPGGPIGNYFAPPGTPANQLGIYTSGLVQNSYSLPNAVQALQSTAAPAVDSWSMANFGWQIQTGGGGQQFFIPNGASAVGH